MLGTTLAIEVMTPGLFVADLAGEVVIPGGEPCELHISVDLTQIKGLPVVDLTVEVVMLLGGGMTKAHAFLAKPQTSNSEHGWQKNVWLKGTPSLGLSCIRQLMP